MEARGLGGKLRLLSNAFVKELGISFLFLFPRDTMTVCLYVLFLCARAALSVLWVVIRRDPNYFLFFCLQVLHHFWIRSFWFAHHGSRERSLLFYYDGKLCKFSFFLSSILFDYSNLFFDICICFFATNKNGEEEQSSMGVAAACWLDAVIG